MKYIVRDRDAADRLKVVTWDENPPFVEAYEVTRPTDLKDVALFAEKIGGLRDALHEALELEQKMLAMVAKGCRRVGSKP